LNPDEDPDTSSQNNLQHGWCLLKKRQAMIAAEDTTAAAAIHAYPPAHADRKSEL